MFIGAERGVDDADLVGRAIASPFTMVTRRNLYAVRIGRFVVLYWKGWRVILLKFFGQAEQTRKLPLLQFLAWPKQDHVSLSRCRVLLVIK